MERRVPRLIGLLAGFFLVFSSSLRVYSPQCENLAFFQLREDWKMPLFSVTLGEWVTWRQTLPADRVAKQPGICPLP